MSEKPKLFALLIDGDNVRAPLISQILDQVFSKYGKPIIRRVYLNRPSFSAHWEAVMNEYSLEPILVPNHITGKNAADIALVIHAMELLYERPDLKGFCIISSDSDFTRLASYIVGKHKYMLGIGAAQTPKSFRTACSDFVAIEKLLGLENGTGQAPDNIDLNGAFALSFIQAYENTSANVDGWVQLTQLKAAIPDHEYENTRQFAEKVKALANAYPKGVIKITEKLDSKPTIHLIRIDCDMIRFIEAYQVIPAKEPDGWVTLSTIGSELRKHPVYTNGFSYRGVRKLSKAVTQMSQNWFFRTLCRIFKLK